MSALEYLEFNGLKLSAVTPELKLQVAESFHGTEFAPFSTLLAISSKYGYAAYATDSEINISALNDLVDHMRKGSQGDIVKYKQKLASIPLERRAQHVRFTADELSLVVGFETGEIIVYNIVALVKSKATLSFRVPESAEKSKRGPWVDIRPNPQALASKIAALSTHGELYIFDIDGATTKVELPGNKRVTSFSWSPKGKQITCASEDGTLFQMTVESQVKKTINPPPGVSNGAATSLFWASNTTWIGVYEHSGSGDPESSVFVIEYSVASGSFTYLPGDELLYPAFDSSRKSFYSFCDVGSWGSFEHLIVICRSNSTDTAALAKFTDSRGWAVLELPETSRVNLPLSDAGDTFALGCGIDYSPVSALPPPTSDQKPLPACPILMLYLTTGWLIAFDIINSEACSQNVSCPLMAPAASLPLSNPADKLFKAGSATTAFGAVSSLPKPSFGSLAPQSSGFAQQHSGSGNSTAGFASFGKDASKPVEAPSSLGDGKSTLSFGFNTSSARVSNAFSGADAKAFVNVFDEKQAKPIKGSDEKNKPNQLKVCKPSEMSNQPEMSKPSEMNKQPQMNKQSETNNQPQMNKQSQMNKENALLTEQLENSCIFVQQMLTTTKKSLNDTFKKIALGRTQTVKSKDEFLAGQDFASVADIPVLANVMAGVQSKIKTLPETIEQWEADIEELSSVLGICQVKKTDIQAYVNAQKDSKKSALQVQDLGPEELSLQTAIISKEVCVKKALHTLKTQVEMLRFALQDSGIPDKRSVLDSMLYRHFERLRIDAVRQKEKLSSLVDEFEKLILVKIRGKDNLHKTDSPSNVYGLFDDDVPSGVDGERSRQEVAASHAMYFYLLAKAKIISQSTALQKEAQVKAALQRALCSATRLKHLNEAVAATSTPASVPALSFSRLKIKEGILDQIKKTRAEAADVVPEEKANLYKKIQIAPNAKGVSVNLPSTALKSTPARSVNEEASLSYEQPSTSPNHASSSVESLLVSQETKHKVKGHADAVKASPSAAPSLQEVSNVVEPSEETKVKLKAQSFAFGVPPSASVTSKERPDAKEPSEETKSKLKTQSLAFGAPPGASIATKERQDATEPSEETKVKLKAQSFAFGAPPGSSDISKEPSEETKSKLKAQSFLFGAPPGSKPEANVVKASTEPSEETKAKLKTQSFVFGAPPGASVTPKEPQDAKKPSEETKVKLKAQSFAFGAPPGASSAAKDIKNATEPSEETKSKLKAQSSAFGAPPGSKQEVDVTKSSTEPSEETKAKLKTQSFVFGAPPGASSAAKERQDATEPSEETKAKLKTQASAFGAPPGSSSATKDITNAKEPSKESKQQTPEVTLGLTAASLDKKQDGKALNVEGTTQSSAAKEPKVADVGKFTDFRFSSTVEQTTTTAGALFSGPGTVSNQEKPSISLEEEDDMDADAGTQLGGFGNLGVSSDTQSKPLGLFKQSTLEQPANSFNSAGFGSVTSASAFSQPAGTGSSLFGTPAVSKPNAFSFGAAASNPAFGGSGGTGMASSGPTFGSSSSLGNAFGKPAFGASSTAWSGSSGTKKGGGFASFASGGTSGFGNTGTAGGFAAAAAAATSGTATPAFATGQQQFSFTNSGSAFGSVPNNSGFASFGAPNGTSNFGNGSQQFGFSNQSGGFGQNN